MTRSRVIAVIADIAVIGKRVTSRRREARRRIGRVLDRIANGQELKAKGYLAKSLGWDGETVRFEHVEARTKGDDVGGS